MKAHMKTHENPVTKFNIELYSATDVDDNNKSITLHTDEMEENINVEDSSEVIC